MPPVFGPVSPSNDALVVLRRGERQRVLAVAEREERGLLAAQEFLDHDLRAGSAEAAVEHRVDGGQRLVERHRDDDALAGGKPVGLDDDRRALRADIAFRRRGIVEALVGGGRNVVVAAQILGEALRAFELRGGLASARTP